MISEKLTTEQGFITSRKLGVSGVGGLYKKFISEFLGSKQWFRALFFMFTRDVLSQDKILICTLLL